MRHTINRTEYTRERVKAIKREILSDVVISLTLVALAILIPAIIAFKYTDNNMSLGFFLTPLFFVSLVIMPRIIEIEENIRKLKELKKITGNGMLCINCKYYQPCEESKKVMYINRDRTICRPVRDFVGCICSQ